MKKKYLLTTDTTPDGIVYTYTNAGLLEGVKILQLNMGHQARQKVFENIFMQEDGFLAWAHGIRCTLVQLDTKITFNQFWDKYDHKGLSSRKKSEAAWKKMQEAEQVKAYMHIDRYFKGLLAAGTPKKYAETYLGAQLWNN